MIVDRISRLRFAQAIDISMRSIDIASRALTQYRLEVDKPDVIINPRVDDINMLEHVDVSEIAQRGEVAAQAALPELKKLFAWHNRLRRRLGV
jgi:NTE family protein